MRLRGIKYIFNNKKIKTQTIKFDKKKPKKEKESQLVSIDAPFTGAADVDAPTGGYRRLDNKMAALFSLPYFKTNFTELISIESRVWVTLSSH